MASSEQLKGIDAFVATVAAGSFAGAAERLNLTGSAVSKTVARLEERLGTRLFQRTTRRLALTDAGTAFHRTCVRVLADLAEAEAVLAAQRSEPVGRLRLDAPATFGRLKVWPLLLRFAEQHPHLRAQISFSDRFVDLLDEGIDLSVRIGGSHPLPSGLGYRHLGHEQLIFCAAPGYLARQGTPASSAEFTRHDAVLYGKADGTTSPWLIAHEGGVIERRAMTGRITVASAEAQVAAVKAGFGVAQLATWVVQDDLARGDLVAILPALTTTGLPLSLIWPVGRQLLPKVDAVLQMLQAELRIA